MMIRHHQRSASPVRAASILRDVFGRLGCPIAFRLWDGSVVSVGEGPTPFIVVVHTPAAFARLIREPTPLNFAEAYVDSAIDIEGDLFAAMDVANAVETLDLPLFTRLRILGSLWAA